MQLFNFSSLIVTSVSSHGRKVYYIEINRKRLITLCLQKMTHEFSGLTPKVGLLRKKLFLWELNTALKICIVNKAIDLGYRLQKMPTKMNSFPNFPNKMARNYLRLQPLYLSLPVEQTVLNNHRNHYSIDINVIRQKLNVDRDTGMWIFLPFLDAQRSYGQAAIGKSLCELNSSHGMEFLIFLKL